jgi:hypothetical protein
MAGMLRSGKYFFISIVVLVMVTYIACTPAQIPEQPAPGIPPAADNITDNQTDIPVARPAPEDSVPRISIEELKQKMDSGGDMIIVDTRHKEEYDVDHIKGAVSAPLDDIIAGQWQPPAGKELILYCG